MIRKFFWRAAMAVVATLPVSASSATLYGSEYGGNAFFEIDTADGSHTTLPLTRPKANGLAHQASTNSLISLGMGQLDFYDLDTAVSSVLAITGVGSTTGLAFNAAQSLLYTLSSNALVGIDVSTGVATTLGAQSNGLCCAIAVRSDGMIFASSTSARLYAYDPTNGFAETYLGVISGLDVGTTSMAFDENDVLYAINTVPDTLVTIDIDTLVATTIGGDIGSDVRGLTFTSTAAVPLPAGFLLLLSGLGGLAFIRRRR